MQREEISLSLLTQPGLHDTCQIGMVAQDKLTEERSFIIYQPGTDQQQLQSWWRVSIAARGLQAGREGSVGADA